MWWRASAPVLVIAAFLGAINGSTMVSAHIPNRTVASPSARQAGLEVANRILALQGRSGVIADSPGGGVVNEDSNMEYALWGLAAGYRATGKVRFLRGLRRGVTWLAHRVVMHPTRWRGSFWYAYQPRSPYRHRRLSPGGNVADVRGVDASSALFVYDLWLYTRLSGNRDLAQRLRPRALAAVDFVLQHDRSRDGFFFSSWQRRRGSTTWRLWRYQYSADQGDVRLGMTAAGRLYGTHRHRHAGRWLSNHVTDTFFLADQQRFALGRQQGRNDTELEGFNGIFPQGYLPWVFPSNAHTAAHWLAGCAEPTGALRCRQDGPAYSLSAAVLGIAQRPGDAARDAALAWVLDTTFHPTIGAVGDSDEHPNAEYSNVDGFTALALLDPPAGPFRW